MRWWRRTRRFLRAHRGLIDAAMGLASLAAIALATFLMEQFVLGGWDGLWS